MDTVSRLKNKKKKLFGILILTGVYALLAVLISFAILFYINSNYFAKVDYSTASKTSMSNEKTISKFYIPEYAKDLAFTNNNLYWIYHEKNDIYIIETSTGRLKREIIENETISDPVLIPDRDILIYSVISNKGKIDIKTYNIDKDETDLQKSFKVTAGSFVKEISYSNLNGYIAINVESNKTDRIYYITLMKNVRRLSALRNVNNMVLFDDGLKLYYQDNKNQLYCNMKKVSLFKNLKVKILGRDSDDNIFMQSLNNRNTFYLYDGKSTVKTIKINDPSYTGVYINQSSLYLAYRGYVVNVLKALDKKIYFGSSNMKLAGFSNNRIYLLNNTTLIWRNI